MGAFDDSGDRRLPQSHHSRRQHNGHDIVQNRQAAADDLQLFPLQPGGGRLCDRPNLYAPLHAVHGTRLLAARAPRVRHVARPRLSRQQRVGP